MVNFEASAETDIDAPPDRVWAALTDPELIARYMMGSIVETTWEVGSPITWKGEFNGRQYEDRGQVLSVEPPSRLSVSHFSPLTGAPDVPENYHTVVYTLVGRDGRTHVSLTQDNASSAQEAEHSSQNWAQMLRGLKTVVEQG